MTNKLAYIVPSICTLLFVVGGLSYQYRKAKHKENEKNARETIHEHNEHRMKHYGGKTKSKKSNNSKTKRNK